MSKRKIFNFAGLIFLLIIWQAMSYTMSSIVIASPAETLRAFIKLTLSEYFWTNFFISFQRIFSGILWGGLSGFSIGIAAGLNTPLKYMLEPLRWVLISIPAVVIVVVAMLWFGMGSGMVIFITGVMISPIIYINTVKGFESIDEKLVEMAHIYRFSKITMIRHLYIPSITMHLISALVIVAGLGVRVVVLAEVLGTSKGIGYALSVTRTNLDVPEMFAWVILCIIIVAVFENLLLKPFESLTLRWRV